MSLNDDFLRYINRAGFCTNALGLDARSGNDLLFSAEEKRVKIQNGAWDYASAVSLLDSVATSAEMAPGLYCRPGFAEDQEAIDDYIGLCYISNTIAGDILKYGRAHFWYFKTSQSANWYQPIFWRWPALISHAKWCAGYTPNLFLRLWWTVTVAFSGSNSNLDPWKLSALMIDAIPTYKRGFMEKWAVRKFYVRLKKAHGNMKAVYSQYFGPDHPITKYCLD